MAETTKTATSATRAVSKRKPVAKRKPIARRKDTANKPAAPKKAVKVIATNAQATGREVLLAGLGMYGKAYDQAQERLDELQKRLKSRRKNVDKLYRELVKRGEQVEKDALSALQDIDMPKLDDLTDRKKLEQQMKKARARFQELKKSVRLKSAA